MKPASHPVRWLFNTLAGFGLALGFVFGWGIVRLGVWLALPVTLALCAVLTWGLYRRVLERPRAVVGWVYAGVCLGFGLCAFDAVLGQGRWWLGLMAAPAWLWFSMAAPFYVRDFIWDAYFRWRGAVGWDAPHTQTRLEVLNDGPLSIHAVTKIIEYTEGGVTQREERKLDRFEVRLGDDYLQSAAAEKDVQNWVIERYRAFRRARRLKVGTELEPAHEVTREESRRITVGETEFWNTPGLLRRTEVLEHAPYTVQVFTMEEANRQNPVDVARGFSVVGPFTAAWLESKLMFEIRYSGNPGDAQWFEPSEFGLVHRVDVLDGKRKVAELASVEAAEAFILDRFRERRASHGLSAELLEDHHVPDANQPESLERIINRYGVLAVFADGEARSLTCQADTFYALSGPMRERVQLPDPKYPIRSITLEYDPSSGRGAPPFLTSFSSLSELRDFLRANPDPDELRRN